MGPDVIVFLLSTLAHAGEERNPFRVEARDTQARPGEAAAVDIWLMVPPKHHVFRDMVQVSVTDAGGLLPGTTDYPPGIMAPDTTGTNGGQPRESYEQDAVVRVPLGVPADTKPGRRTVALHVRYQGCSEKLCFFPQEEDLRATVEVLAPAATAYGTPPPPAPPIPAAPPRGCGHVPSGVSLCLSLLAITAARFSRRGAPR
jgi:hypothetical protein